MAATKSMDDLRLVCRTLGEKGRIFNNPMIYESLGASADDQPRRDRIRRRCTQLIKSGELDRIGRGEYRYIPDAAPRRDAPLFNQAWRAVKSAKPGFSAQDIARRSGATYSHICRWFRHLESEDHIKQHGRDGNTILYRATEKARQTSDTPLSPLEARDPFETEREALCEMVRIFMLGDPYAPATQNKIIKNCRAILDRFENNQEVA